MMRVMDGAADVAMDDVMDDVMDRPAGEANPARQKVTPPAPRLLDCGEGRRLERFGAYILDRPAPPADRLARGDPLAWAAADARFDRVGATGAWSGPRVPGAPWEVGLAGVTFELRLTSSGQVGLFPEQVPVWRWIRTALRARPGDAVVLNLFAYTGGATLAAALAGAAAVHVDGSRGTVAWARRNAQLSGLSNAPIRWIVEDAEAFVARELRRGHRYDGIVLDPPSYGHGPHREQWRLEERLPDLLRACATLASGPGAFIVLTTHTPGFDGRRLARVLAEAIRPDDRGTGRLETGGLGLVASSGVRLPLGAYVRWVAP